MATQAPNNLPLLYRGLEPLNRQAHGDKRLHRLDTIPAINEAHAVPVTVDEFMLAGRFTRSSSRPGNSPFRSR
jgi:hypothetical protein